MHIGSCALLAGGLIGLIAQCTTEKPERDDGHDAAPEAGPPSLSAECAACVEQECELPWRACEGDPVCKAMEGCWIGATTGAEAHECLAELVGDAGHAPLDSLTRCALAECGTVCPAAPVSATALSECQAQVADLYVDLASLPPDYHDCACERCSPELDRCSDNPACVAVVGCMVLAGCDGQECFPACVDVGTYTAVTLGTRICLDQCRGYAVPAGSP